MKLYIPITLRLINPVYTNQQSKLVDISKKAAIEYRAFMKAPLQKTSKIQSGEGTFKKVYAPNFVHSAPGTLVARKLDYVLVKMSLWDSEKDKVDYSVLDDVIKEMAVLGLSERTIYVSNIVKNSENKYITAKEDYRICMYVPKVRGHDLRKLLKNSSPSLKDKAGYLIQYYQQVKKLHFAGFCHYDLKPGNVMVDPISNTATMIDFGSIRRSWQVIGVQTPSYHFIRIKQYSKKYFESVEKLTQLNDNLKDQARKALSPEIQKWANEIYNAAVRMNKNTYSSVKNKYKAMELMGVRSDMAALFQIAVELGLWQDKNHQLFMDVVENVFNPYYVEALMTGLKEEYSLDLSVHDNPMIAMAETLEVIAENKNDLDVESLATEVKNRYMEVDNDLEKNFDELAKRYYGVYSDFDVKDIQTAYTCLKSIDDIYKFDRNNKLTTKEKKRAYLSLLISFLGQARYKHEMNYLLTKIFVVSLVNRGVFGIQKEHTTSFKKIHEKITKTKPFADLLEKHWDSRVDVLMTPEMFYSYIQEKAKNEPAYNGVFVKTQKNLKTLLEKSMETIIDNIDLNSIEAINLAMVKCRGLMKNVFVSQIKVDEHQQNTLLEALRKNLKPIEFEQVRKMIGDEFVQQIQNRLEEVFKAMYSVDFNNDKGFYLSDLEKLYENPV